MEFAKQVRDAKVGVFLIGMDDRVASTNAGEPAGQLKSLACVHYSTPIRSQRDLNEAWGATSCIEMTTLEFFCNLFYCFCLDAFFQRQSMELIIQVGLAKLKN